MWRAIGAFTLAQAKAWDYSLASDVAGNRRIYARSERIYARVREFTLAVVAPSDLLWMH